VGLWVVVAAGLYLVAVVEAVQSDRRTLRQQVVECQCSVNVNLIAGHPLTPFSALLDATELIVRARVGPAVSRLTGDEMDIYTTYDLLQPQILFRLKPPPDLANDSSSEIKVELHGGLVQLVGFTAGVGDHDYPPLRLGDEVILCLRTEGDHYRLAMFGGAFGVANNRIQLIGEGPNGRELFAGRDAQAFAAELVAWRKERIK
jgi:hypothetical protein